MLAGGEELAKGVAKGVTNGVTMMLTALKGTLACLKARDTGSGNWEFSGLLAWGLAIRLKL
jgi:hypothetical protein